MENYSTVLHIAARTMIDIAKRMIVPAVSHYARSLAEAALAVRRLLPDAQPAEESLIRELTELNRDALARIQALEAEMAKLESLSTTARAIAFRDRVIPAMTALRTVCDSLETRTAADYGPLPSYGELLFGVR